MQLMLDELTRTGSLHRARPGCSFQTFRATHRLPQPQEARVVCSSAPAGKEVIKDGVLKAFLSQLDQELDTNNRPSPPHRSARPKPSQSKLPHPHNKQNPRKVNTESQYLALLNAVNRRGSGASAQDEDILKSNTADTTHLSGRQGVQTGGSLSPPSPKQPAHSGRKIVTARGGTPVSASPTVRVKQYAPVKKGDLSLPGGPQWQGLRRRIKVADPKPQLPTVDALVVVEGPGDWAAVRRAVNVPCYVTQGNRILQSAQHLKEELVMLSQLGKTLVVLTDPDERGRELREFLDSTIGPLHHAFIPADQARSYHATTHHDVGNLGVEHAPPAAIADALGWVRFSYGGAREAFSFQDLVDWGLANEAVGPARDPMAPVCRAAVCSALGLGECSGSQLLAALNRYFSVEEVRDVVDRVREGIANQEVSSR